MISKKFDGKKIVIKRLEQKDLEAVNEFQGYINSLIEEDAKILMKTKKSEKEEHEWLKDQLDDMKKYKAILLVAKDKEKVVGIASIKLGRERESHIGDFGISVKKGYRSIGLGTCLMREIVKRAKESLRLKPKIITLKVFANNKPAIGLYKKMGFQKVARLPNQIQFRGKLIDVLVMHLYL